MPVYLATENIQKKQKCPQIVLKTNAQKHRKKTFWFVLIFDISYGGRVSLFNGFMQLKRNIPSHSRLLQSLDLAKWDCEFAESLMVEYVELNILKYIIVFVTNLNYQISKTAHCMSPLEVPILNL